MKLSESQLRRLIREEAETNMMLRDVDDILDETIMSAAPEIVMAIREREVDEDIDEFIDGALLGSWEAGTQSYADPPVIGSEAEVGDKDEVTEMYLHGYDWGWDNPGKIKGENIPDPIRREMVEYALDNFKGRVTEEFVINALETVYNYGKEQLDDVHGILKKAWKKYGWKIAPAIAGIEIFEHAILPGMLATINPAFLVLTTVPTLEILAAAGLAIAKAIGPDKPEPEHVPGHLDWYEEEGKEMRESKMRITRRQLRRIIREASRDLEGYGQIHYPEGYERTNVDKVYEIIQPLFDASNVGADRQGEISMEIADMYNATVDNPDEIYNHAEELLKIDAGYYDEAEEDWDEYPEQAQASREAAWEERNY